MFIIDFTASEANILSAISHRDIPAWAIPVFDFISLWFDTGVKSFGIQTSGSTGTPKLIHHSREAMIASAERTCDFFQLKKGDTALLALPATHIGGKMMLVRSIIRGMKLICVEPRSNPLANITFGEKIEFAAFTPMQMSMILDDISTSAVGTGRDLSLPSLPSLRHSILAQINNIILGGGEVPYPLIKRLQEIPSSVYETYGMTETISHIALKKINGADRSEYFTVLEGVKITVDERGCLMIKAPHLSTQKIITNDIVNIISDKKFQWLGRYDNIINTGGIKVSAEEVERKLQPYIDVNFFITGIADDVLGRQVTLVLESDAMSKGKEDSLQEIFSKHLNKYERPRKIIAIEKFIYTGSGKVNKNETMKKLIQK
jgi:O-succinylbenzoic acid--CoA ligase